MRIFSKHCTMWIRFMRGPGVLCWLCNAVLQKCGHANLSATIHKSIAWPVITVISPYWFIFISTLGKILGWLILFKELDWSKMCHIYALLNFTSGFFFHFSKDSYRLSNLIEIAVHNEFWNLIKVRKSQKEFFHKYNEKIVTISALASYMGQLIFILFMTSIHQFTFTNPQIFC